MQQARYSMFKEQHAKFLYVVISQPMRVGKPGALNITQYIIV